MRKRLLQHQAFALLLAASPVLGLDPQRAPSEYSLAVYGTREGLPQGGVFAIAQAPDGSLQLRTTDDVVSFDGMQLTVGKPVPYAGERRLLVDRSGALWGVGPDTGVWRRHGGRQVTWTADNGLPGGSVKALLLDREGTVWVGTVQGLSRIVGRRAEAVPELAGMSVTALAQGQDGALWIAAAGRGVGRRDASGLAFDPGSPAGLVSALLFDRGGTLWAATDRGLGCRRGGRWRIFTVRDGLPSDAVKALAEDRDGNLWIGTEAGLARHRDGRFAVLTEGRSFPDAEVLALLEDVEGALWVGTRAGGLVQLRDTPFASLRPPGAEGLVWSAAEDADGTLWLASSNHGVVRLQDGRVSSLTTASGLPADRVRPLLRTRDGALWIGTAQGLARLQNGRIETWTRRDGLPDDALLSLFEDRDGTLWAGTYHGLASRRGNRWETAEGIPSDSVYAVVRDRSGTLRVSTRRGLFRLSGGRFVPEPGFPPGLQVFTVAEDTEGTLWAGTRSAGLFRLRDGRWTAVRGLADDTAYYVLDDRHGSLWMTSNRGIYRAAKADLEAAADGRGGPVPHVLFGHDDGLAGTECSGGTQPGAVVLRDGRLLFPTVKGFALLDPERQRPNLRPPPVAVGEVLADGAPARRGGGGAVELPPGWHRLEIHYTALSLLAPEKVRFLYRLEGYDTGWVAASSHNRQAVYTALPPGAYTFRVKAANADGVWNEAGAALPLTVRPRLWETAWFRTGGIALIVLAALGTHRLRLAAVHRRERSLARLVGERTRDLEQEKTRAEEASRAKSEFLANMSHEIRTPLNAVLGMADSLRATPLSAAQQRRVAAILDNGEALLAVLNDILEVSKIEAGVLDIEIAPFSLRECLEGALDAVRPKAQDKGLALDCTLAAGLPEDIESDAKRLRQVLVNLLHNAVKFTARGGVRLVVERGAREEGALELRFAVHDTGIGIPPEQKVRLFKPFGQADSSTTRVYGGTGLGLVICRRLVERLGGVISFDSVPGEGSVFRFTLPCRPAAAPAVGGFAHRTDGPAETPLATRLPLRILVAEDNPVNQQVALLLLEDLGYRADLAANGKEALDAVRRRRYDVVFLDLQMPEMDGLEAARRIRSEIDPAAQPRLIAMTASALREQREACRAAGMDDFLSKPILTARLSEALRRTAPAADAIPVSVAGEPPLDPTLLQGLRQLERISGKPLVAELVERYLKESAMRLERMRQAAGREDAGDLSAVAHSLKGSSGQLGVRRIAALSSRLEEESGGGSLAGAPALIEQLAAELALAAPLLRTALVEPEQNEPGRARAGSPRPVPQD